jgi:hypothetical protein
VGTAGQRERERRHARAEEQGRAGPGVAHAGRKGGRGMGCQGEKGAGPREGEGRRVGLARLSSLFLLLSFFFSILKLFKHNYLNSNKFEFKPYKLNTRNTMLQHECTNMLTL